MKELYKALSDFQNECPVIFKGTKAYSYSYADLTAILTTINPILKKYKLAFSQLIDIDKIKTIICHYETGQMLESTIEIPKGVTLKGQNEIQSLGSEITYLRRYSLSCALGLITDADLDACSPKEVTADPIKPNVSTVPERKKIEPDAPKALFDLIVKNLEQIKNEAEFNAFASTPEYSEGKKYTNTKILLTGKWNKVKGL